MIFQTLFAFFFVFVNLWQPLLNIDLSNYIQIFRFNPLLHKLCNIAANNDENFLFLTFNGFNSSNSKYGIYPSVHPLIKNVLYYIALYLYCGYGKF